MHRYNTEFAAPSGVVVFIIAIVAAAILDKLLIYSVDVPIHHDNWTPANFFPSKNSTHNTVSPLTILFLSRQESTCSLSQWSLLDEKASARAVKLLSNSPRILKE